MVFFPGFAVVYTEQYDRVRMKKNVFRSRISVLFLGFLFAVFLPFFISLFRQKPGRELYIPGGILLFIILLVVGIRYVISEDKLFVKIFWCIPTMRADIAKITGAERSYNLLSSPAASLKRLKITFAKGMPWLISPVREELFLKELKKINPSMEVNVVQKKGRGHIRDWDI